MRRLAGCIIVAALAATGCLSLGSVGAALAQDAPLPTARPSADALPGEVGSEAAGDEAPHLPRSRPLETATPGGLEPARGETQDGPRDAAERSEADDTAEAACRARLRQLGAVFVPLAPIEGPGGCGVPAPIEVSVAAPGLALTPPAILDCRAAEALARWSREVVRPAARTHLGSEAVGLAHASTYVCRSRNDRPGAKLSEHATATAIDIAAVSLAGRDPVPIEQGLANDREQAFRDEIRKGACAHFTTVLGPGSDSAHATHLHLDLAQRKGGRRMCQ